MSRVFISGIAGFLGSHLADALLALGHEVWGCDNLLGGDKRNVPSSAHWLPYDCLDLDAMNEMMAGVEVVYHLAACPHEGLSVFSPSFVTKHTYLSTLTVATAAINNGVKRVVFSSSMARYGDKSWQGAYSKDFWPFIESQMPSPVDPYGIAKVAAEDCLRVLGRIHGMEVVIAVPHSIIGERQKYDDVFRNVASIMINMMLQERQPFIYGDGMQKRCFSYVGDCIPSLVKMGFQEGLDGEIINIGPDEEPVTILGLAQMLAEIVQVKLEPVFLPARPCEVKEAWCSSAKARRLLDYQTRTPLREALQKMVNWIVEQGVKPFVYHLPLEIMSDKMPATWKNRLF